MSDFVSYNAFNKTSMQIMRQVVDLQRLVDRLQKDGLEQDIVDEVAEEVQKFDGLIGAYKQGLLDVIRELTSEEDPTITGVSGENGVEI
tara:strand:- start:11195 stop:11461 length:267 start_codon:yes stop_codon:yes gene_type:complete